MVDKFSPPQERELGGLSRAAVLREELLSKPQLHLAGIESERPFMGDRRAFWVEFQIWDLFSEASKRRHLKQSEWFGGHT